MVSFSQFGFSCWDLQRQYLESCRFELKQKGEDGEFQTIEVTVYDYFVNHRNINLRYSADLPCVNVGRPKRPTYFPIEVGMLIRNFFSL